MSRYNQQYGNERGYGDRYDRLTNYNNPREQSSSYSSDMYYDDHYESRGRNNSTEQRSYDQRRGSGAAGGGRSGGRYDRDSHQQQSFGKDDRRQGNRGGYSQMGSGGLLGASPNEPMPAPSGGNMLGNNTTQQHVLAALQAQQTQNLLVALQAQQMSGLTQSSLLPTPGMSMQRGGKGRQFADRNRQRQQLPQKRRNLYQEPSGVNKKRRDDYAGQQRSYSNSSDQPAKSSWKQNRQQPQKQEHAAVKEVKPKKAEGEEDDVYENIDDKPDPSLEDIENVEIAPELIEKVEELRKRTKVDRNIADQDVDKLGTFHFDGQNYRCKLCKIVAKRSKSIKQHLMGKKHSLNVIEARQAGNDVDRAIMDIVLHPENWLELNPVACTILKQQTLGFLEARKKEEEEYRCKHPENFVTYRIDTRKSGVKNGDTILITSVCESNVAIKEYASEKQIFGCEFIKASVGFNCRLCDAFFNVGTAVIEHIKSKEHSSNYQKHLEVHAGYHEKLVERNREIVSMLEQHEGKEVVMYETFEEDTEDQKNIPKQYIKPFDPDFVYVEKGVVEMHSREDEADDDMNAQENGEEEEGDHKADVLEEDPLDDSLEPEMQQGFEEEGIGEEPTADELANEDVNEQLEDADVSVEQADAHEPEIDESGGGDLYEPSEPTVEEETAEEENAEEETAEEETEVVPEVPVAIWTEPERKVKQEEPKKFKEPTPKDATPKYKIPVKPVGGSMAAKTSSATPPARGASPRTQIKPQPGKMSGRGRGARGTPRGNRGGRMTQRARVVKKPVIEESFEVVDEVGAGDEE